MTMLTAGARAPAFDLPDLEGRRHRLQEALRQGPVLAVFWKAACGTCHLALPYFQRLTEAYPPGRWQVLGISQDGVEASGEFARRYGLSFPMLIDGEGLPASREYDPDATPTAFLINGEGTIDMTSVGFYKADVNELSRRIAEHIGVTPQVIAEEDDGNPPFKPG
jgi:peroxiredoxin Q/BCP